jgi:hypothetical protein
MRTTLKILMVLSVLVGLTEGCHRKKGGGYLTPASIPVSASQRASTR